MRRPARVALMHTLALVAASVRSSSDRLALAGLVARLPAAWARRRQPDRAVERDLAILARAARSRAHDAASIRAVPPATEAPATEAA